MKGFVIELHASFAFKAETKEEAIEKIFNTIDLNETYWEENLIAEMSEEEFDEVYGED